LVKINPVPGVYKIKINTIAKGLRYNFILIADDVSGALLDVLMDQADLLLASKSREVVQAALGFVKVLLSAFKDVELAKYLKNLVSSLVSMKEDNRHHFRFKAKELFERLIRKFGFVTVEKMVPASHSKLLHNIRKTQERLKRQRKAKETSKDDEDSVISEKLKRG
jgi:ribosomal RNA-processing protein 12